MKHKLISERLADALTYETKHYQDQVHKRNILIANLREEQNLILKDSMSNRTENVFLRNKIKTLESIVTAFKEDEVEHAKK